MAFFVAYELDPIFGFIGYPSIFQTGNDKGKEFMANEILVLFKEYSEAIITVTGRPRPPSGQGSVESMNKLVERIIADLENKDKERLKQKQPHWTRLLGRAMQTINSKCGRGKYDVEPYKAVFGQSYHKLNLSADERLRNIAEEISVSDEGAASLKPPKNPYREDDEGNITAAANVTALLTEDTGAAKESSTAPIISPPPLTSPQLTSPLPLVTALLREDTGAAKENSTAPIIIRFNGTTGILEVESVLKS